MQRGYFIAIVLFAGSSYAAQQSGNGPELLKAPHIQTSDAQTIAQLFIQTEHLKQEVHACRQKYEGVQGWLKTVVASLEQERKARCSHEELGHDGDEEFLALNKHACLLRGELESIQRQNAALRTKTGNYMIVLLSCSRLVI